MIFESLFNFLSRVLFFTGYIHNNGSFPRPLSPEDEKKYVSLMLTGDVEAREMLIKHNLRLVAHITKKYTSAGEADDLISVGSIGLVKGVDTYKPEKGCALATYAARCIQNEILMYIRKNKKHDKDVSIFDVIGSDKDGNDTTRMDILPDGGCSVSDSVEMRLMMEKIQKTIEATLDEREKEIVNMRYGLLDGIMQTQFEVADKLEISRSYVSRIEKKAISKLKNTLKND